ncbi:HAD-IIB family hydrolase [Kitasatospora saccharophila]|uniref:HAD-IIB family hydrolase n=1 Tax=Kitasatospora saccharophila TaxID=407973 RepID=UPI003627CF1D
MQEALRAGWPGAGPVRAALRRFPGLVYQHGVAQDGRCSYHLAPDRLTDALTSAVEALGCAWVYSGDRYFDVLPPTASKGNALRALAAELGWRPSEILVAGDSLNDLSLFRLGAHGVVVPGAEPALLAALADTPLVHRPEEAGAAGIHAALRRLGWLPAGQGLPAGPGRSAAGPGRTAAGRPTAPGRTAVGRRHSLVVAYHRPRCTGTATTGGSPAAPTASCPP